MTRSGRLRPLPESLRDRIRNDLNSSAATPGHFMRSMLAFLAVYAGVALLLPGSPAFRAAALVLAVVLALVDSFPFIAMNTQRRSARRHEHEREQYQRSRNDRKRRGTRRQSRVVMTLAGHFELTEQELDA